MEPISTNIITYQPWYLPSAAVQDTGENWSWQVCWIDCLGDVIIDQLIAGWRILPRLLSVGRTPLSIAVTRSTLHPYVDLCVWWLNQLNHKSRGKWWKMITCQHHHIYELGCFATTNHATFSTSQLYSAKTLDLQRAIAATLILQHTPSGTSTVVQQSILNYMKYFEILQVHVITY